MIMTVYIGVNFCKAARLELPQFSNSKAFRLLSPPHFLPHATPIMKLFSVVYKQEMTPNDIHDDQTTCFSFESSRLPVTLRSPSPLTKSLSHKLHALCNLCVNTV